MGRDIHTLLEIKKDGKWEPISDELDRFNGRSYRFFTILDNHFDHRGIPEELKDKKFGYHKDEDYWDFDFTADWLFGFSFVGLNELKKYIDNLNKVTVSEEFLEKFFELGGVLPDGMTTDPDGNGIYVEPMDEEDVWFMEFLEAGVGEIEEIAQKYDVSYEDIRMVFAFDW